MNALEGHLKCDKRKINVLKQHSMVACNRSWRLGSDNSYGIWDNSFTMPACSTGMPFRRNPLDRHRPAGKTYFAL